MSARALQIAQGAPVMVKIPSDMKTPEEIVTLEFEKGSLPLTVVRELPDGSKVFINVKGEEIGKAEK